MNLNFSIVLFFTRSGFARSSVSIVFAELFDLYVILRTCKKERYSRAALKIRMCINCLLIERAWDGVSAIMIIRGRSGPNHYLLSFRCILGGSSYVNDI